MKNKLKCIDDSIQLPTPISLTHEQTVEYSAIMRQGNLRLRACADALDMDHRAFRAKLFKGRFSPVQWPGIKTEQINLIEESLPLINEVRKLENVLLSGFVHLVLKHANNWGKRRGGTVVDFADYVQESVMALMDAIYAYTLESNTFMTFAWNIIRNRCASASNKNHPLNPLTNEALGLMQRFENEKRKLATIGPINDEDVIEAMKVNESQTEIIRSSLVKVVHSSQVLLQSDNLRIDNIDFGAYMQAGIYEDDTIAFDEHESLYKAIKDAGLTAEEDEALKKFMHEERGWETALAKERGMTRAGISFRVRRAIEKVKDVLLRRMQEVA